ncbi:hypothetical protein [Streptomyces kaniharaensis]|uniref:hypothetical protein n=1 Tax=Streptomyces kaniharaensis TaxID=212423 RepID=UPI00389A3EA1
MSHPLTRRIAQAALLVAAGATPLVAAGSASALGSDALPKTDLAAPLGQLATTDAGAGLQQTTHQLGEATGATTVAAGVPTSADAARAAVTNQLSEAKEKAGSLTAPVDRTAITTGQLSTVTPATASALAGNLGQAVTAKGADTRCGAAGPVDGLAPAGSVTQGLPGADKLTGAVPGTGTVTDKLGSVERELPAGLHGTDVLGLAEHGSANRLGGVDLGSNNTLSGLTGALGQAGGTLHGVNGGTGSGLAL